MIAPVTMQAYFDTTANREGAQHEWGPPDGTTSAAVGDDTYSLNRWIDGEWVNHYIRTLLQESGVIDMPGSQPDLIVEWAILDDWFPGVGPFDDFIGVLAADRNNNGMIDYPDEIIGFIGRCSLATNETYIVDDGVTGKPRWVHWINRSRDESEYYHYIYDAATNTLKIYHHRNGKTIEIYKGPPIQDPSKIPPPDPPSADWSTPDSASTGTAGTAPPTQPGTTTGTTTAASSF
jgi:hypothetical protein